MKTNNMKRIIELWTKIRQLDYEIVEETRGCTYAYRVCIQCEKHTSIKEKAVFCSQCGNKLHNGLVIDCPEFGTIAFYRCKKRWFDGECKERCK